MKTLTTVNWVLVGLYGILIVYLIGTNNNPNNDAAGRGMLSGIIVGLFIFAGVLTFLNFRDAKAAKITVMLLGGIPLLFISTNLVSGALSEAKQAKVAAKQVSVPVQVNDEVLTKQTVLDFLDWYQTNLGLISQINLVDQQPGKVYSVNTTQTERYLIYLQSSEMLTERFLNEWRTYFKERQAGFQLSQQNEGPPTGFDYDLVMLTQDVDMQMISLNTLKINSVQVNQNKASVKFLLLEEYEFRLVKLHNKWIIDEILNLSAE